MKKSIRKVILSVIAGSFLVACGGENNDNIKKENINEIQKKFVKHYCNRFKYSTSYQKSAYSYCAGKIKDCFDSDLNSQDRESRTECSERASFSTAWSYGKVR